MDEGVQKRQTSTYKIKKSWGRNVQHGDYSQHITYMKVAKRVDLRSCPEKTMVTDSNQTYCGDDFTEQLQ